MVEIVVEWYEHPDIEAIDDHVAEKFKRVDLFDKYLDTFSSVIHREDWRRFALRWVEDWISELEDIRELIEELDEDEREEVTIDE